MHFIRPKRSLPIAYNQPSKLSQTRKLVIFLLVASVGWWAVAGTDETKRESTVAKDASRLSSITQLGNFRVGLQAGHLDAAKLPAELESVSWNFGASAGGVDEVDVNLETANAVAELLRKEGVQVDVLPATIPPGYLADAFISIHADGNEDASVSGYKAVASAWDKSGKAEILASSLRAAYGAVSKLELDSSVTRDMTHYYAFNYNRFEHAISPQTPAVIFELGFITNAHDRKIMTEKQDEITQALSVGILEYLKASQ
jgi:N-acetylmuramoyl-L-alanine amidase